MKKLNNQWDQIISTLDNPHILQTSEWGEVKKNFGWKPVYKTWTQDGDVIAAALILIRELSLPVINYPFKIIYIPKGPIFNWENDVLRRRILEEIINFAKEKNAIFLKIDPDVLLSSGVPGSSDEMRYQRGEKVVDELKANGWLFSSDQIQFRNTVMLDLLPDEDTLLSNMKQKTRYNIRLAERKGVVVRIGEYKDFDMLFEMYAETSIRDGFVIRSRDYYLNLWRTFYEANMAKPFIAEYTGEPIAALFFFHFARKGWYLFGMSKSIYRKLMPNYLLQWKAIQYAKKMGCQAYDFWGAPDEFVQTDPMWGVYRFKSGLGGKVLRFIGAWDYPIQSLNYQFYIRLMPRYLDWLRERGKNKVKKRSNNIAQKDIHK